MNRGFYEYEFSITDDDTIPLELVNLAFNLYFDGKHSCDVDIAKLKCPKDGSIPLQLDDDNISKFLYLTNEILSLNLCYKIHNNPTGLKVSGVNVPIREVKRVLSVGEMYLTYIKMFVYNYNDGIKFDVVTPTRNRETLKWIFNAPMDSFENHHQYVNFFMQRCEVTINRVNVWDFIDDYSIQNTYALNTVIALKVSLDDIISVLINTQRLESPLYDKYVSTIEETSVEELQTFLSDEQNQQRLNEVYERLSVLNLENSQPLENLCNALSVLELSPTDTSILLLLFKSLYLSKDAYLDTLYELLKALYEHILSSDDLLNERTIKLLQKIGIVLQAEYPYGKEFTESLSIRTQRLHRETFDRLINISAITIGDNPRRFKPFTYYGKLNLLTPIRCNKTFLKKTSLNFDSETFKDISRVLSQYFWIYNPNFDFSHLNGYEKILVLTTPELLLKYIYYYDTDDDADSMEYIFMDGDYPLNIGATQVLQLKHNIYHLLNDKQNLSDLLELLKVDISIKDCMKYLKALKECLQDVLNMSYLPI
jgi:hypothetical protein